MPRWTVTRKGVEGPGAGGQYTYSARAESAEQAVEKTAVKANRLVSRINRGNTVLDPTPTDITRID
ncbi:hypothetical protein AAW14_06300 [Streptomyces hygroscopicus]|uniref:hypothetical protein n=1 Tax=Streptomyces hygroscopicus TaxID=1912 RepID=UPI002240C620|nr:hypothetical protein [Streptomyces hygroscopicus]MCW7941652.1 hypothetical protein [Streptomyces hygroscopicus]